MVPIEVCSNLQPLDFEWEFYANYFNFYSGAILKKISFLYIFNILTRLLISGGLIMSLASCGGGNEQATSHDAAPINRQAQLLAQSTADITAVAETTTEPTWTTCAAEGGVCSFTGTRQVRYGANGIYYYRNTTDSVQCTNTVFGDPVPYVYKSCAYSSVILSTTPSPTITPTPVVNWTNCATEGGLCSFSGTRQVRYGTNGTYFYRTATDSVPCTNAVFGDPVRYSVKTCAYSSITTSSTANVTVTAGAGGMVISSPSGISCGTSCNATFASGTSVTLNAQPNSGYTFGQWGGACSGTVASCVVSLSSNLSVTASFVAVVPPPTGGPYVAYTDAISGPIKGGEGNNGAYISIFGKNFGSSGLGSSTKVYIGGVQVANYRYLGLAKVGAKLGLQQITVQVGNLGNPTLGVALPVKVVVNGTDSNVNNTFTPSSGRILFVSLTGNDATAVAGDITKPWRYLQNISASPYSGAYFAMTTGDHIVLRGGSWSDTKGVDRSWMKFSMNTHARNGTATRWIHITAYPGPILGNAIEDVHYTTPTGTSGGIQGPWSAIAGTSGEYISVSNLRMDVSGGAARDAAPINFQYTAGPWRVVNNELGPWVAGNSAVLNAAGVSGHGDGMKVLGNHIHNIEGLSDLQNHGIYADTTAQNWEVAYNWIHDAVGGSLVQFNDNSGGAGSYVLPHTGLIWPGFVGIRIHHNWLENAAKYGINFNDQGSVKAGAYTAQIWNNVIIGTALPPMRINSTQPIQNIWFAYNTIYNSMRTTSGSGNGMVRSEGWSDMAGVRNKFYNNIFAFGPSTVSGTQWLANVGGTQATTTTYDFKRNLYYANGQSPYAPSTIGDSSALATDPLFTNAGTSKFTTQLTSPARKAGTQALPSGFVVMDDITGFSRGSGTFDLGAFQAP